MLGVVSTSAEARARELLVSLLRPSQRDSWRAHGTFWVHTERGWFRLGTLYDIRYRSPRMPWVERSVCVVTEGFEGRPLPDLWAELVVAVQAIPEVFTAEANFRSEAPIRLPGGDDIIALRHWIENAKARYQRLRRLGAELDAAYLAFDVAHRVARSCRPRWAGAYAASAAEVVAGHAERYPAERETILAAHQPILDFGRTIGGAP